MILLPAREMDARRALVASAPGLQRLADSLARDLDRVLATPLTIPPHKARLTRHGGRCHHDGTLLEFDPWSPHAHSCPACRRVFEGEEHYRWWVMGYHLWLAERTVHAAVLHALRGLPAAAGFVHQVLDQYADCYLSYPNADNALGPTRPFFSTYLESIWLLQLCLAASMLEEAPGSALRFDRFRERVVQPSAELIASFDEGASNRQVWNAVAMAAAGLLCDERSLVQAGLTGPAGIAAHLAHGLLPDGSWYEGENYHLFAHRGLWYGVHLAAAAGMPFEPDLLARFDEGSAIPFLTALPDFTFPARRDSQYGVSLRQWRFAELAELGLARQPHDPRLRSALATLYDGTAPEGSPDRWRSMAETERNAAPRRLTRADLGWRSLLMALPQLPPLREATLPSVLLPSQGFAVLRRDHARVYVGLDYGHSGGGHGHPDRLNLLLADGETRWLDDPGTGSYVDPTLHWYRSTLAHNAPVVNGRSQRQTEGMLLSWDERGGVGWVEARVDDAYENVGLLRTVIVFPDYLLDRLIWWGDPATQLDLPLHVDGTLEDGEWTPADPGGSSDPADGYAWLREAERSPVGLSGRFSLSYGGRAQAAAVHWLLPAGASLWRALAPAPGAPTTRRRFHFLRCAGQRGVIVSVWSWRDAVAGVSAAGDAVVVTQRDGAVHRHERSPHGWRIALTHGSARSSIELTGRVDELPEIEPPVAPPREVVDIPRVPDALFDAGAPVPAVEFELGGVHYRRSEVSWHAAGSPTAVVALMATESRLIVEVAVARSGVFAPARAENPLDNEHPDVNSDGVQLYIRSGERDTARWILVPEPGGGLRVTPRTPAAERIPLDARWRPSDAGWEMRCTLPLAAVAPQGEFQLDLIVNETSPERERRRGQLVLSGGAGEYVYLRGDRQPESRFLFFRVRG